MAISRIFLPPPAFFSADAHVSTSILAYELLIFEVRTISRIYYQPGPMDPYVFYKVSALSVQEISQLMSSLDRNCCFDSSMADLSVCNCVVRATTTNVSLKIQQQKCFQLMVLDD